MNRSWSPRWNTWTSIRVPSTSITKLRPFGSAPRAGVTRSSGVVPPPRLTSIGAPVPVNVNVPSAGSASAWPGSTATT